MRPSSSMPSARPSLSSPSRPRRSWSRPSIVSREQLMRMTQATWQANAVPSLPRSVARTPSAMSPPKLGLLCKPSANTVVMTSSSRWKASFRRRRSASCLPMLCSSGERWASAVVASRAISPQETWQRWGRLLCSPEPRDVFPLPGPPRTMQRNGWHFSRAPTASQGAATPSGLELPPCNVGWPEVFGSRRWPCLERERDCLDAIREDQERLPVRLLHMRL
mmetsp:Transcript_24772/g.51470  ORF Transcript_24772/g.51470 Transcript_24772/m.51470 type:complete len:221 (+) Transcript_24772:393-1055(+)